MLGFFKHQLESKVYLSISPKSSRLKYFEVHGKISGAVSIKYINWLISWDNTSCRRPEQLVTSAWLLSILLTWNPQICYSCKHVFKVEDMNDIQADAFQTLITVFAKSVISWELSKYIISTKVIFSRSHIMSMISENNVHLV